MKKKSKIFINKNNKILLPRSYYRPTKKKLYLQYKKKQPASEEKKTYLK